MMDVRLQESASPANLKELEENSQKASHLLRVMANEKRLLILCNLMDRELSVHEIQDATGLGQSTVSQQLAILRAEKIVSNRRQAQSVYYKLISEEAAEVLHTLHRNFCARAADA